MGKKRKESNKMAGTRQLRERWTIEKRQDNIPRLLRQRRNESQKNSLKENENMGGKCS